MPRNHPEENGTPTHTEMMLTRHILRAGEHHVATHLGLSPAAICRKVNGSEGWTLRQLGQLLDLLNLEVAESTDSDEMAALKTLVRKYLEDN